MKAEKFKNMTLDEKTLLIMEKGKFISKGSYSGVEIDLYKLEESFVEIWYDIYMDKISKIEYLQDRPVNPYLKFLKVSTDN
jgi:hypothetical protein